MTGAVLFGCDDPSGAKKRYPGAVVLVLLMFTTGVEILGSEMNV